MPYSERELHILNDAATWMFDFGYDESWPAMAAILTILAPHLDEESGSIADLLAKMMLNGDGRTAGTFDLFFEDGYTVNPPMDVMPRKRIITPHKVINGAVA